MNYSDETQIQQLVSLLHQYGISKVVASPGSSNVPLVASLQSDEFFEMYSCVDERSAAYLACGIAAEANEPVLITCTGATASRNYLPGLTEAFYRKLPVLCVTASMNPDRVGHMYPQMMDRSSYQNDICTVSTTVKPIRCPEDGWANEIAINTALSALTRRGGGPAHINLVSDYGKAFTSKNCISTRKISRHYSCDAASICVPSGKVAVYVGAHISWSDELTEAVDAFCEYHNGAVIVDHTSNYHGRYGVLASIISMQEQYSSSLLEMDLLIHIGEVSGSYYKLRPKKVWRVSPDGEMRDFFKKLTDVFEMEEFEFFRALCSGEKRDMSYYSDLVQERKTIISKLPDVPFSNIWCASRASGMIPANSVMHFGILNSLRSWNLFDLDSSIDCYSNTGGFGIDGCVSALVGGALAKRDKLHFIVVGDLAFFYDLNAIGLRDMPNNVRIMLVNNGVGIEFKNYNNIAAQFGDGADRFIAAKGHNGFRSDSLVKDCAASLGFGYLSAKNKEEFLNGAEIFFSPEIGEAPMLFEVFTNDFEESNALKAVNNLEISVSGMLTNSMKNALGEKGKSAVKKLLGK